MSRSLLCLRKRRERPRPLQSNDVDAPMHTLWSRVRPYERWWSVLPVLLLIAANVVLPIVVYNAVASQQSDNLNAAFARESTRTFGAVQSQLIRTQSAVQNMRVPAVLADNNLTSSQFTTSVNLISRVAAIAAIAWLPYVTDDNKAAFEQHVRAINANGPEADMYTNFTILELKLAPNVSIVPASGEDVYFPYLYAWPSATRQNAGIDLGTLPAFFGNLSNVIDSGGPSVLSNVALPGDPRQQGILVYYPVYRGGVTPSTVAERRRNALGLLASSAQLTVILNTALADSADKVSVFVFDGDGHELFGDPSGLTNGPASVPPVYGARYQAPLPIADSQWTFVAVPTAQLKDDETSDSPGVFAAVTAVGIFLILLLTLYGIHQIVRTRALAEKSELRRKRVTAMIGYVNHEIRNPLQGVMGLVEHATMKTQSALLSPVPGKEDMRVVLGDLLDTTQMCDLMHHIVNDVLDIRNLEEGKLVISAVPTDIDKLVSDVVVIVQPKLNEKQRLTLEVVPPSRRGVVVKCDAARLKQVLLNFLTNAIKFSDAGSIQVSYDVVERGEREGDTSRWLHVAVKDTGSGIPSDKTHLVFSPFMHLDTGTGTGRHQGAGLGLYLCSMLVEAMGGRIGFDTTAGVGSTFWFDIPYVPLEESSDANDVPPAHPDDIPLTEVVTVESPATQHLPSQPASAGGSSTVTQQPATAITQPTATQQLPTEAHSASAASESIELAPIAPTLTARLPRRHLVCDDVRINRVVLRRYLEGLGDGVEVSEAENGQRAIELAAQFAYDIIWMDVRMPFVDGVEATKTIRAGEGPNRHTPIVGVTGDVTSEEVSRYRSSGMEIVMSKPVKRQDIAKAVEALVAAGRQWLPP